MTLTAATINLVPTKTSQPADVVGNANPRLAEPKKGRNRRTSDTAAMI